MINYSVSPRGNSFEGKYEWPNNRKNKNRDDYYILTANSARDMLQVEGFRFDESAGPKIKLPSIIVANLVSPRVDYHGHDKSRVDTAPFIASIIEAIHKVTDGIRTFRAAGYIFESEYSRKHDAAKREHKVEAKDLVEKLIRQIRAGEA